MQTSKFGVRIYMKYTEAQQNRADKRRQFKFIYYAKYTFPELHPFLLRYIKYVIDF